MYFSGVKQKQKQNYKSLKPQKNEHNLFKRFNRRNQKRNRH